MKPSPLTLSLLLAAALTGCHSGPSNTAAPPNPSSGRTANPNTAGTPGAFDFYLLNLSWSPEYCHSHSTAAECAAHDAFVLHGLWPENTDGTYPEACSNAPGPADPSQYKDIYPDPGLLQHEWQQHGTCSGLSADAFFQASRTAFHEVTIPPKLSTLTAQTSLLPTQIIGLFTAANPAIPASSLVVTCGNNYLTAVEVCLDKNLHATSCGNLHTCGANTVRIPPP